VSEKKKGWLVSPSWVRVGKKEEKRKKGGCGVCNVGRRGDEASLFFFFGHLFFLFGCFYYEGRKEGELSFVLSGGAGKEGSALVLMESQPQVMSPRRKDAH